MGEKTGRNGKRGNIIPCGARGDHGGALPLRHGGHRGRLSLSRQPCGATGFMPGEKMPWRAPSPRSILPVASRRRRYPAVSRPRLSAVSRRGLPPGFLRYPAVACLLSFRCAGAVACLLAFCGIPPWPASWLSAVSRRGPPPVLPLRRRRVPPPGFLRYPAVGRPLVVPRRGGGRC